MQSKMKTYIYRYDPARALIGQKAMFYRSIKHRKGVFYCFSHYLYKANEEAQGVYYTVIKHSRLLGKLEKSCRKHSPASGIQFYIFPSCSQMPVVFYHSVTLGLELIGQLVI